jgi:cellulose biosynthesis protein BcsQ
MAKLISIFNNKAGVGKTTYMFHVAHMLARKNLTVLMIDCDSQCNLTTYALRDADIVRSWRDDGNSIFQMIEPVYRTIGDIRNRAPTKLRDGLYLVPGDLRLSEFEDRLGDTWNSAKGGSEPDLRAQSAIHRSIWGAIDKIDADTVLIDLGPNLGALNRAVLASSDYFVTPVAPDLFSIQGTQNLGNKLVTWRSEWDQCNAAWGARASLKIPLGRPIFLGYVIQMHNLRTTSADGMTDGWAIYGDRLEPAINKNIVDKLKPLSQVIEWEDEGYKLGQIPNLHSLIPYSLRARKPVFDCTSADGLRGAHIAKAAKTREHFEPVANILVSASKGEYD